MLSIWSRPKILSYGNGLILYLMMMRMMMMIVILLMAAVVTMAYRTEDNVLKF